VIDIWTKYKISEKIVRDKSVDEEARVSALHRAAEIEWAKIVIYRDGPTAVSQAKGYPKSMSGAQETVQKHLRLVKNEKNKQQSPHHYEIKPTSSPSSSSSSSS
jgi:hypothetical protein